VKHFVELDLPPGCVVKGFIPASQSVECLDSDMAEIDLPDGTTIDVGWVPAHDPDGSYRVVVFRDYWEFQEEAPVFTASLAGVVEIVCAVAHLRAATVAA